MNVATHRRRQTVNASTGNREITHEIQARFKAKSTCRVFLLFRSYCVQLFRVGAKLKVLYWSRRL